MAHLKRAHDELFRRTPDEQFTTLQTLSSYCREMRDQSVDRWELPEALQPASTSDYLQLGIGGDGAFLMNDWSFGQLCRLAKLPKQTVNRLSPDTAKRVFFETLAGRQQTAAVAAARTASSLDSRSQLHSASQCRFAGCCRGVRFGLSPATKGRDGRNRIVLRRAGHVLLPD